MIHKATAYTIVSTRTPFVSTVETHTRLVISPVALLALASAVNLVVAVAAMLELEYERFPVLAAFSRAWL